MSDTPSTPAPAATVVLVRPAEDGLEVFLVKRHRKSGFMGAFHVFPGGRVDADDHTLGADLPPEAQAWAEAMLDGEPDPQKAAAFALAAVRETAEECGVLLARQADGTYATDAQADAVFDALKAGTPFADLLEEHGLLPDLLALHPFAWWITPAFERRRYDTRFFLAEAPAHQTASFDDFETTEGVWLRPAQALAQFTADEIALAPPTMATLERLQGCASFADAQATTRRPIPPICPEVVRAAEGGKLLVLPGDPLFPAALPVSLPHRTRFQILGPMQFR